MKSLSLNGEWNLTYNTLGHRDEQWGRSIRASVPGDIHLDLLNAGLICEPLISDNSKKYHWIEEKEWWYSRSFTLPDGFISRKMELVCEGLDLTADILINGNMTGHANNMFVQHRFDVTEFLLPGSNEISIRLDVGFESVKAAPVEKFSKSWGREEPRRPWMRKAQQAFYWDTAPRLITCGIWRDVYLESFDEAALRDAYVTSSFADGTATLNALVEIELLSDSMKELLVEWAIHDQETSLVRRFPVSLAAGLNKVPLCLTVENPSLWWPNGMGEAHLYDVSIKLLDSDGLKSYGEKIFKHGFRRLEILQESINEQESTFTFVINGCKVFCKGGNWVPPDSIYARIDREKEYRLLQYAHDANFNMLRVWGGGIYPDSFFFETCDQLGILVWQDFMYACAYYPDDEPEFYEAASREAQVVVRKFRNHASLALWCGNNEIYMMHARVDPHGHFYGFKLFSELLPGIIQQLDPKTPYIPSDPYPGPWPGQERKGTQHIWSYVLGWHDITVKSKCDFSEEELATVMRIRDIPELNHKFVSEFGIFGPSNRSSIIKFMGENPLVVGSDIYQHHRNHFEADFILEMLRRYYIRREEYSFDEFTLAGQMIQAETLKYIFEEFRSRMYVCSGTLFWEYNDSWGHIGYSPVDYYLNVKPLYFYMQRAFTPLHVVFTGQGDQVVILNDSPCEYDLEVEYGCQTFQGTNIFQKRKRLRVPACSALQAVNLKGDLRKVIDPRSAFVYARLFDVQGQEIDRNRQFLVPVRELQMPEDSMRYDVTQLDGKTWKVVVSARDFVWMVKLDADEALECSDNAFDLWPGESKTVIVQTDLINPSLMLRVQNINQYINRQG